MTKTQSALERVIIELDSWCDNWTPTSYNDPRISLRQIADRARDVLDPRKKMTDFQPTPQTPEQVDEGLRNAFRQAKEDGVVDATPYLNQTTFNTDIEKTEAEIKVLQKKLELLKEIETHNEKPEIKLELPRKSLEEIQQEFDEKIDDFIERTKNNFYKSKYIAETLYQTKFNRIIEDIEYARENGSFPLKFTLDYSKLTATGDYSKLTATGSNITSNFVIKSGAEEVGYYTTGNGYLRFLMDKKPNFIVRFCMNKLLDFRWIDT